MGYRCHIVKHYEVEYTDSSYFNNSKDELLKLLEKVELFKNTWMSKRCKNLEISTEDITVLKGDYNE